MRADYWADSVENEGYLQRAGDTNAERCQRVNDEQIGFVFLKLGTVVLEQDLCTFIWSRQRVVQWHIVVSAQTAHGDFQEWPRQSSRALQTRIPHHGLSRRWAMN